MNTRKTCSYVQMDGQLFCQKTKKVLITLCDPQECKNKNQFPFTVFGSSKVVRNKQRRKQLLLRHFIGMCLISCSPVWPQALLLSRAISCTLFLLQVLWSLIHLRCHISKTIFDMYMSFVARFPQDDYLGNDFIKNCLSTPQKSQYTPYQHSWTTSS